MEELELLKSKGLIKDGFTEFVITGDFGKVELTELLKEYKIELLNKITYQLLEKGEMKVGALNYTLQIYADDWHNIFKTDEYNKLTKK